MNLVQDLKQTVKGEVLTDEPTLELYSHDTSIFEIKPQVVVFPQDVEDIKNLVRYVAEHKKTNPQLSLTPRSAGTDMTGGAINDSIILDFTKHLNHIGKVDAAGTQVQPGAYYRDFEKETLQHNLYMPSYPASKNICALGGMVNNNAGGEKTLVYGKTIDYVQKLKMVLSDGNEYEFAPINREQLEIKMKQDDFEGQIYRRVFELADQNYDRVKNAKPKVSKNSTGYNIWDVWDRNLQVFDLTKLFVGSQGTLGITTDINLKLVKTKPHSGLLVIYLNDIAKLPELVNTVVATRPENFEAFDDHTLRLALRFIPKFIQILGLWETVMMGLQFLPQLAGFMLRGLPKFTLLAQYSGDTPAEVKEQVRKLDEQLQPFEVQTIRAENPTRANRYWVIRRESFNLLRKNVRDKHAAPFIDDLIVPPSTLPEFFPRLTKILDEYELLYTIAGHMGDGNFHIIPLMDLSIESERAKIPLAEEAVMKLVLEFGGSVSAEHNEGLVRGPYIRQMYGDEVFEIFKQIKQIFDPQNIFNPHKKTDANLDFSLKHIRTHF